MKSQVWLIKVALVIEYKHLYVNLRKEFDMSFHDILIDKAK